MLKTNITNADTLARFEKQTAEAAAIVATFSYTRHDFSADEMNGTTKRDRLGVIVSDIISKVTAFTEANKSSSYVAIMALYKALKVYDYTIPVSKKLLTGCLGSFADGHIEDITEFVADFTEGVYAFDSTAPKSAESKAASAKIRGVITDFAKVTGIEWAYSAEKTADFKARLYADSSDGVYSKYIVKAKGLYPVLNSILAWICHADTVAAAKAEYEARKAAKEAKAAEKQRKADEAAAKKATDAEKKEAEERRKEAKKDATADRRAAERAKK